MKRSLTLILVLIILCVLSFQESIAQNRCGLDSQKRVYTYDISGNWEIYIYNEGEPINLTQNPSADMNPNISPDGQWIVFHSSRDGNYRLYKIDLVSPIPAGTALLLTPDKNDVHYYDASWNPDSSQIVFKKDTGESNGHGDIWVMDTDGSNQTNLTADRVTTEEWVPRFSQDGQLIYFVSRLDRNVGAGSDELFVMNIDGSAVTQITSNAWPDWYPAINPLDGRVAFISKEHETGDDNIYQLNSDMSRSLLVGLPGDDNNPVWGCGSELTFINNYTGTYQLYTLYKTEGSVLSSAISH